MYDVLIIGGGVVGCSVARELSRKVMSIAVLEAASDICEGTSKANSGIAHAGYDAVPNTLKAKLNVRGSELLPKLSKELDIPFRRNGSLVLCFEKENIPKLHELYERGIANGVKELRIIGPDEVHELEPNISDSVVAALYAPTGGIVCPFGLTIAMAENAAANGAEFFLDCRVTAVESTDGGYRVTAADGRVFDAEMVINAAGVYADEIHNMLPEAGEHRRMKIIPRAGEYCLYDREASGLVDHTIFQLPGANGKGILVTPTVHGNILVGPTATVTDDKEATNTTREGMDTVLKKAALSVKQMPPSKQIITSFAGIRAHLECNDFVIEESPYYRGFIDVAGIASPGLTAAPAIGEYVADIVEGIRHHEDRKDFIGTRRGIVDVRYLDDAAKAEYIRQNPLYANIICRCESISEGEIVDAIHRPVGATTIDGVKRRTRAGMGRCQGGFCSPKVTKIISRELGIPMEDVRKSGAASVVVYGNTK